MGYKITDGANGTKQVRKNGKIVNNLPSAHTIQPPTVNPKTPPNPSEPETLTLTTVYAAYKTLEETQDTALNFSAENSSAKLDAKGEDAPALSVENILHDADKFAEEFENYTPNPGDEIAPTVPVPACVKMRVEKPETYPQRFPIPVNKTSWDDEYPQYTPPYHEGVGIPARDKTQLAPSYHYPHGVRVDENGYPLNPAGRTGIQGRGDLWNWGPNHAADPILTRENDNVIEILLIRRDDNNQYALPGGMVDPSDESSLTAAARELHEEANIPNVTFSPDDITYKGVVDDRRSTDNAWVETVAVWKHYPHNTGNNLTPQAGSDAAVAVWVPLNEKLLPHLYASHGVFVREVMKKFNN